MTDKNSNDSGLIGSWIIFILLGINVIYSRNYVSGIIFLLGSFVIFDTYRRIHKSYSSN